MTGGFASRPDAGCRAAEHPPAATRRGLLQAGGLGLFSASLADLLRLEAAAGPGRAAPARSVIFIFQAGGPSQFETWDPKPDAPPEIRGDYAAIGTAVPELRVCEHLPKLAARAHGRRSVGP